MNLIDECPRGKISRPSRFPVYNTAKAGFSVSEFNALKKLKLWYSTDKLIYKCRTGVCTSGSCVFKNKTHGSYSSLRMKVSRQRAYQLRMREEGRCIRCGRPAAPSTRRNVLNATSSYCEEHKQAFREYQRERSGSKRRNFGAGSYQRELLKAQSKAVGK